MFEYNGKCRFGGLTAMRNHRACCKTKVAW
jgi:hypothetical protein